MTKTLVPILLFLIISGFCNKKTDEMPEDVPTFPITISCINMQYVKEVRVISDNATYESFLAETNASNLIGSACDGYVPPKIDFNTYHLFLIHSGCGGCEEPDVTRTFRYNNQTDLYEYCLIFKQKGICKVNRNYFESVLVKKSDVDESKLSFSSKIIMPERQVR